MSYEVRGSNLVQTIRYLLPRSRYKKRTIILLHEIFGNLSKPDFKGTKKTETAN